MAELFRPLISLISITFFANNVFQFNIGLQSEQRRLKLSGEVSTTVFRDENLISTIKVADISVEDNVRDLT